MSALKNVYSQSLSLLFLASCPLFLYQRNVMWSISSEPAKRTKQQQGAPFTLDTPHAQLSIENNVNGPLMLCARLLRALLAEADGPRGVKILPLKPHYHRLGPAWGGGAADCFQLLTLSHFVKGEIEGFDRGHGVRGWRVAVPFSENQGLHLGKQVHRLIGGSPVESASHQRRCLRPRSSWKRSLI